MKPLKQSLKKQSLASPDQENIILKPLDCKVMKQIAAWQKIAINHSKKVMHMNGLIIDEAGKLAVDEKLANEYKANFEQSLNSQYG